MRGLPIVPLDARKQFILKAVVTDYVRTVEPVGSRGLMARYEFGVRSATIRNEMAELSDLGFLHQPHTSAGRIPSDLGYRFFVDRLMDRGSISEAAMAARIAPRRAEMDVILEQTCRILSELAHYTSLATHPTVKGAVIKHVTVADVSRRKMLVVVVLSSGGVLHDLLEFDDKSKKLDAIKATNFLMAKLAGRSLESLAETGAPEPTDGSEEMRGLLDKVVQFVRRELESAEETDILLEGASYIMQQPEFRDAGRLEAVLSVFEERKALYKLFSSVYLGPEVTVIIGSENPLDGMRDCSFVGTKYRIGGRVAGTIGVVGPTRMDYRRAVGAVQYMARNLEDLLTDLSVA